MKPVSASGLKPIILNHFFSPAKSAGVLLDKFGAIQIDPLTIVSKNHLLVFAARNEKLSGDYINKLYEKRKVVEVFAKERCIVPVSDAYLYASRLRQNKEHWWSSRPLKEHPAEVKEVLSLVKTKSEVSPSDFSAKKWNTDHSWRSKNIYTSILGALHETGELIISGRNERRLSYSLPPADLWLAPKKMSDDEIRLKRYERYLDGVLLTDARDSFAGFERSGAGERRAMFNRLMETGAAFPVDGVKHFTVVSKRSLARALRIKETCLPVFIPPLDNSIWNRELLQKMWSFRYRWEIYTPPAKREFGPFAMPLVTEDGFFGPVDFKFDRSSGMLIGKMSGSPLKSANRKTKEAAEVAAQKLANSIGSAKIAWL